MTSDALNSRERVLARPIEAPRLICGSIFAITGGLWMLMCAHAAFDFAALAMIYWNVESDVAHLLFR